MRFRLIPTEDRFFDLFEGLARTLAQASQLLTTICHGAMPVAEGAVKMKDLEHEADRSTHEVFSLLNRTFITPLDREDIYGLAHRLDDVIDFMDGACGRMNAFKVTEMPPFAGRFAAIIVRQVAEIGHLMGGLKKIGDGGLLKHCEEINRLENEGDQVLHETLADLFLNPRDPLEVMKWREICGLLEKATDRCEDVANVVEGIVLKNA